MNDIIEQLLGYLRGIWRNRWYAMGCAWLVCVIGWIIVCILPKQYEASARVFVDAQTILRPVLQGLTVDINPSAQVEMISRTLFSRPNLEKIAQLTGLDNQAKDSQELERLLNRLKGGLDFNKSGTDLYTITYVAPRPELAKKMVETVLGVFEKNLVGNTQLSTNTALQFLEEQIDQYEYRLTEAETRLKDFKIKNAGWLPSEGQNYYTRVQQIASALEAVRLELAQAENRRNALQQQLDTSLQQQLKGDGEKTVVLPIDNRIQDLEKKLDELLIQYTDKHPDVGILRQTIADLKRQRVQERSQYTASLSRNSANINTHGPRSYSFIDEIKVKLAEEEANIASLQVRMNEYKKRYKELQDEVNILPQVEADLAALNRDYDVNKKKHEELISRREALRLSEQAEESKQEVRYKVVDPPRIPLKPKPTRLILTSVVLVAGLGIGVGLAFLISQFWPTFDSRRSLMQIADIPVFGSVSAVLSQAALRRERKMTVIYAGLGGMLVLIYAGLMIVERVGYL
ncbi:MAG TPA: Wzz/FepE/Etk N-terminal domain-containing protein [Candidatus Competibacter sp.]|nr:Wzz/FepE/Etk N-terminal domain-containing protein [Candidatus Competibacter sp.]